MLRKAITRISSYLEQRRTLPYRAMKVFEHYFPDATFVQIGSNDGMKHDPIAKSVARMRWHGIMIEPVPYVFDRLKANYLYSPQIALENVAISSEEGEKLFYYTRESMPGEELPDWYDELGSFNRDVILSHADKIPDLESRIVEQKIPCITFEKLCENHSLSAVNLLHMDTEGHDFEIIKTLNFKKNRPELLIYEHWHLSGEDRRSCELLLRSNGYFLIPKGANTWCLNLKANGRHGERAVSKWKKLIRRLA